MSGVFFRCETVADLPDSWDELAKTPYQRSGFLQHAENTHPCKQRYYTLQKDGTCLAGAVVYSLKLDVLTYFPVKLPFEVAPELAICGIPASVSCPGLVGPNDAARRLLEEVVRVENRFFVVLNLESTAPVPVGMITGATLPAVVMELPWMDLSDYGVSLRSDYRRRFSRIRRGFSDCETVESTCEAFTSIHHDQYLAVLHRSDARLETLPLEFFQKLPENFHLVSVLREGRLLGWVILLTDLPDAYFFMGGMPDDRPENLYFYLTTVVLEHSLKKAARRLDLGQTAEVPKLRLGGKLSPRLMAVTHPSGMLRLLLTAASPLLSWQRDLPEHHVFSQD